MVYVEIYDYKWNRRSLQTVRVNAVCQRYIIHELTHVFSVRHMLNDRHGKGFGQLCVLARPINAQYIENRDELPSSHRYSCFVGLLKWGRHIGMFDGNRHLQNNNKIVHSAIRFGLNQNGIIHMKSDLQFDCIYKISTVHSSLYSIHCVLFDCN